MRLLLGDAPGAAQGWIGVLSSAATFWIVARVYRRHPRARPWIPMRYRVAPDCLNPLPTFHSVESLGVPHDRRVADRLSDHSRHDVRRGRAARPARGSAVQTVSRAKRKRRKRRTTVARGGR